jgi:hypothetical protein
MAPVPILTPTCGSMLKAISKILHGHIHFPDQHIGKTITMEDGHEFRIFRDLTVSSEDEPKPSMSVFKVRFKFKSMPVSINKRLSMIPTPFLIGLPGFREKIWTMQEEPGEFQGIYQWDSLESAQKYPDSFIFKVMTKRAVPDTVSIEILPDTILSEYVSKLL